MGQTFLDSRALPSNRKFGSFFTVIFGIVSVGLLLNDYVKEFWFFAAVSALTLSCTILRPSTLYWPNRLWYRLGVILGKIVSPIVLGALFFGVISPTALITRLTGRDVLRLKKQNVGSYWLARTASKIDTDSFKNQF